MIKYIAATVLFPLLATLWESKPFTDENVAAPQTPYYLSDVQLSEQARFYTQTNDPRLRCRVARTLSQSGNASAVPVLEKLLESEKDETVTAELLASLFKLSSFAVVKNKESLKRLSTNSEYRIRAIALSLRAASDGEDVLNALKAEDSLYVKNLVWRELAAAKSSKLDAKALVGFLDSTDQVNRAGAAKILAIGKAAPDTIKELGNVLKDTEPSVRTALAEGLSQRKDNGGSKLSMGLCDDAHASVRCAIAATPSTRILEVPLKLSKDKDWEVRRVACLSMAGDKAEKAVDALLQCLADNTKAVRNAAEAAIIKTGLSENRHQALGDLLDDNAGRCSAIRVAGFLGLKKFEDKIDKILSDTTDRSTIIRSIKALGRLDRKDSWKLVESKADSPDKSVRRAVAFTLGRLAVKDTFPAIIKLTNDKDLKTAAKAVEAIGVTRSPSFASTLFAIIKNLGASGQPRLRAAACWSIAKTSCADQKIIKQLSDLCLAKVVQTPMGLEYDADFVRAAACWALVDACPEDDKGKKIVQNVLYSLTDETKRESISSSIVLSEYARQARLRFDKKEATPLPVPPALPPLIAEKSAPKKTN